MLNSKFITSKLYATLKFYPLFSPVFVKLLAHCCVSKTGSAESYLNQALVTYDKLYGSGHAKTLEVKDELARLMIRTDRIEVCESPRNSFKCLSFITLYQMQSCRLL